MELNEKHVEQIAHAYRDTIYLKPNEDPKTWEACREHWMRDTRIFLAKLAELGFTIVPGPRPPVFTQAQKRSPVDPSGGGRFG